MNIVEYISPINPGYRINVSRNTKDEYVIQSTVSLQETYTGLSLDSCRMMVEKLRKEAILYDHVRLVKRTDRTGIFK